MILVDTSVWVEHLPAAVVAGDAEVLLLIERDQLMGRGNCRLWTRPRTGALPQWPRSKDWLDWHKRPES